MTNSQQITKLRVLIVEDDGILLDSLVRTVSIRVWTEIRNDENNPYDGITVEKAETAHEAKRLIMDQEQFDLFILDLCIPNQTARRTGTYNGLHLIHYSDGQGKKPKAAISLTTATGEGISDEVNSDMGRDYLQQYFHQDNILCLHKGATSFSATDRLFNHLTMMTASVPKILKLLLPHRPFTISFMGMNSEGIPIINLYSSHREDRKDPYKDPYLITEENDRQFLYFGYQHPGDIISAQNFAQCFGIVERNNSVYANRFRARLCKITKFHESYIKTYLFSTVHGQGFKLLANYRDESSNI